MDQSADLIPSAQPARRPRLGAAVLACVFGLLGFGSVVYATDLYGVGVSTDSIIYASVGDQLVAGKGVTTRFGAKFVSHPPLFPVMLGLVRWGCDLDSLTIARYLNALLYGLIVALSIWIAGDWLYWAFAAPLVVGLWMLFSIPLLRVATFAWSEPLFILWLLLLLHSLKRYLDERRFRALLAAALFAGLAALTRYAGVVLIGLGVWVIYRCESPEKRIRRAVMFGVTSSFVLAIWLVRNWAVSGTWTGRRPSAATSLGENLHLTGITSFGWFFPEEFYPARFVLVGLVMLLAVIVVRRIPRTKIDTSPARILLPFVVGYPLFLVIISSLSAHDPIAHRLLSPLYGPLVLFTVFVMNVIPNLLPRARQKRVRVYLFLMAGLWALYPALTWGNMIVFYVNEGAGGYAAAYWMNNETVRFLKHESLPDGVVYSNRSDVLYHFFGIMARVPPSKVFYQSDTQADNLADLKGEWPETNPAYLVWIEGGADDYLYTVDELRAIASISIMARFDDGAIYEIRRIDFHD